MRSIRGRRPSPSMAIALLALFVSLGGSSYAVSKIGTGQIANNSVRSEDLRNNSVQSKDVRDRSLLVKDFKKGQLPKGNTGPQGPQGAQAAAGDLIAGSTGEDLVTLFGSEERFPPSGYSPAEPGVTPGGAWTVSPNAAMVVRDLVGQLESPPGAGTGGRFFQILHLDANAIVLSCLVSGTATTCDSGSASGTLPPKTRYTLRIFNGTPSSGASNGAAWSFRLVTP